MIPGMAVPEIRDASPAEGVRLEAWDDGHLVGHATARPVQLFAVDRSVPPGAALISRVLHVDSHAVGFADSIGHEVIELCPAPQADPATPSWAAWCEAHPVPDGAVAVGPDSVAEVDLEEAWVDYYVWAHEMIGPLKSRADVAAASAGLRAELDHEVSTLLLRGGRVVALSLVWAAPPWDGVVRVLAETPRVDEPGGEQLVAAALARTLTLLADRGVRPVELEGRTFDPHLPAVAATFPPHQSNPMSVVRLRRSQQPLSDGSATLAR